MIKQKSGHIVSISSMAGITSTPYMIAYGAAKHGVNGFMANLSQELYIDGHDYIKTTLVCPYFINTRKEMMDFINLRFKILILSNNYNLSHFSRYQISTIRT